MNPTICTVNGSYFNFVDVKPNVIFVDTIARALSNLCRFNGQIEKFYSVAQHSVICSQIVPEEFAMQALFHDAAEAYIGDITKPLKALLPDYQEVEKRVETDIFEKLAIEWPMHPSVKHADLVMLATERRDLFNPDGVEWVILKDIVPAELNIFPLLPEQAYRLFMDRYLELK
jgi:uncharacterized protein